MAFNTTEERLLTRLFNSSKSSLGDCGAILINDASVHTDKYTSITALTEVVLSNSGTASKIADFDVDITIPAGVTIFGKFSAIQASSGTLIAYKAC